MTGSSPHTRGARVHPAGLFQRQGIISAYAGSTSGRLPESPATRDHPRIRGEHLATVFIKRSILGSSPHTRGAPHVRGCRADNRGIIPAYAGSTSPVSQARRSRRDHPRIRGEHCSCVSVGVAPMGSSPHTRGALIYDVAVLREEGIIPAYAGSTRASCGPWPSSRDHPRIRGEHPGTDAMVAMEEGSSPHTRGAHCPKCGVNPAALIIPAYAGSTH